MPSKLRGERDELRESLGRIGAWSFALETLTAAEERDAVAEIESFGYRAIWFPESVESREVFAHASWILASTERALVVSGIANIWARDPTAMANGWRMLTDAYPRTLRPGDRGEPRGFGRSTGQHVRAAVHGDA